MVWKLFLLRSPTCYATKILDERTKLPEIPDSRNIYHNKKSRFSTLIIDIDALEVTPFSPFSNKAYSEENIYNEP